MTHGHTSTFYYVYYSVISVRCTAFTIGHAYTLYCIDWKKIKSEKGNNYEPILISFDIPPSSSSNSLISSQRLCYILSIYRGHIWYGIEDSTTITMMKLLLDLHSRTTTSSYGRAMGCLPWFIRRKMTRIYWERTLAEITFSFVKFHYCMLGLYHSTHNPPQVKKNALNLSRLCHQTDCYELSQNFIYIFNWQQYEIHVIRITSLHIVLQYVIIQSLYHGLYFAVMTVTRAACIVFLFTCDASK